MGNNHGWINFSWAPKKKWTSCLDWDTFVVRHQRACLLWKHICLLRCVQKPKTSLTSQHVCASTGCERYFNLYMLYAFFSFNSVPRQVDFRHKVLPSSRIHMFYVWNGFFKHDDTNRRQPIFLRYKTRKVHLVIQQTKDSCVHCWCVLRGPCWICASTFFRKRGGYRITPGHAACMYAFETNIAYTIFVKCVYIATPFSLITFCYIKVFCTVSRKNQLFSQENSPQKLRARV